MATDPSKWPQNLTNTDWQKKKGVLAKGAGKTGIGEAMTAAQRAHQKIDWTKLHVGRALQGNSQNDPAKVTAARAAARTHYTSAVKPVTTLLDTVAKLATTEAAKWKQSRVIPASAARCATDVAESAKEMSVALSLSGQVIKTNLATFDVKLKTIADGRKLAADAAAKQLDPSIVALEHALTTFKADRTLAKWTSVCQQPCRNMANAVSSLPALKAVYWDDWKIAGQDDFFKGCPPDADAQDAFFKPKVAAVTADLAKFKTGYAQHLT